MPKEAPGDSPANGSNGSNGKAALAVFPDAAEHPKHAAFMRRMLLLGLLLGVLLSALDATIVGTSLPKIVADIGGFEHFAWVFSAYMLAATCVIPIAGKLSDLYGRRVVYMTGMVVFLAGSVLSGMAQTMTQLILLRGLQGIGGGILFPVAMATVADIYAPSDRGKIQGIIGSVFGSASVVGPFIGGWIVDYLHVFGIASWRWVFYINVPVGAAALFVVSTYFPRLTRRDTPPLDYTGAALMTTSLVALILATIWGGDKYAWGSPEIVGLLSLSIGALLAFAWVETRAKDPIVAPWLFKDSIFTLSSVANALTGVCMFGVISFLPTYMQGVVGISATYSGAVLLPLTVLMVFSSFVSGMLMARLGYKVFMVVGCGISAAGLYMLSLLGAAPPIYYALLLMMFLGVGFGFIMQTYTVASQNIIPKRQMGAATSTLALTRSLGQTLGVTVLGTVLNEQLRGQLPTHLGKPVVNSLLANPFIGGHVERIPSLLLRPDFVAQMQAAHTTFIITGIKAAFSDSISSIFLISAVIAIASLVVSLFIKSKPLKSSAEYHNGGPLPETTAPMNGDGSGSGGAPDPSKEGAKLPVMTVLAGADPPNAADPPMAADPPADTETGLS